MTNPPFGSAVETSEKVLQTYGLDGRSKQYQQYAEIFGDLYEQAQGRIRAARDKPCNGTANLFMFFEPLANWRHVEVTQQRTKVDFAHCMQALVDDFFPDADCIHVVLDNLNTHKLASLYDAFPPHEAHRIARKLRFHYTPKHGSWLNMAEIEFSILARQCLSQRIPSQSLLQQEVAAWQTRRNDADATINWRFTTHDARIKLKRLYPSLDV